MSSVTEGPAAGAHRNSTGDVVAEHRRGGRVFTAARIRSFVLEAGSGPNVLCMHGMWGSSFLPQGDPRARVPRAAWHAFDLPGFGFAGRPKDYDYSWSGLGRFAVAAVDELQLDRFHLVVHDIGGPVGFELASKLPERVATLTIFNTMIDVTTFKPPWSMQPFRYRGLGEMWLKGLNKPMFRMLMRLQGVRDRRAISDAELNAYLELMKGDDRGRSFLRIMRRTEHARKGGAVSRSHATRAVSRPGGVGGRRPGAEGQCVRRDSTQSRRAAPDRIDPRQALPARGSARADG